MALKRSLLNFLYMQQNTHKVNQFDCTTFVLNVSALLILNLTKNIIKILIMTYSKVTISAALQNKLKAMFLFLRTFWKSRN